MTVAPEIAPPCTADSVLFEVLAGALVRVLSQRKGEALLRAMADDLRMRESLALTEPIRPAAHHAPRRDATLAAQVAFFAALPGLIANLSH